MTGRRSSQAGRAEAGVRLRSAAFYVRWIGALVSLALTYHAGRHNRSILLVILFAGWVLLPYFGLIAADRLARRTPPGIASAMRAAILLLAAVPPLLYALVSILAPGHPTTFSFLAVPAATWLGIATLIVAVRLQVRSNQRQ